jgi:hypothetical protein
MRLFKHSGITMAAENETNPADNSSPELNDTVTDVDTADNSTIHDASPSIPREPASRTDWLAGTCFFLS